MSLRTYVMFFNACQLCCSLVLKIYNCGCRTFFRLAHISPYLTWACLVTQTVKNLPAMQETWFSPWVGKTTWRKTVYPLKFSCLEKSMDRGTHGLQSLESQRVRHNRTTNTFFSLFYTCLYSEIIFSIIISIFDSFLLLYYDNVIQSHFVLFLPQFLN